MKRLSPWLVLFAVLLLLFSPSGAGFAQDEEQKAPCCFTNVAYSGVCSVTPSKDESCDTILQYLNTQGTVGKDYCGGSKTRGGWSEVACTTDDESQSRADDASKPSVCSSVVKN